MEVRIIKNDKHQSWYRDRIGEVFNVIDVDEENKQYIVHKGRILNSYINFEDCEIIANEAKTSTESVVCACKKYPDQINIEGVMKCIYCNLPIKQT